MTLRFHPDAFSFVFGSMDDPPLDMTPSSDGVWRYRPRDVTGAAPAFYIIDEPGYVSVEECDAYFKERARNLQTKTPLNRRLKSGG